MYLKRLSQVKKQKLWQITVHQRLNVFVSKTSNNTHINFIMKVDRVVAPLGKIPYYRSDGTGRDTYIRDHNGGLLSKDRLHSLCLPKPIKERSMSFGKT